MSAAPGASAPTPAAQAHGDQAATGTVTPKRARHESEIGAGDWRADLEAMLERQTTVISTGIRNMEERLNPNILNESQVRAQQIGEIKQRLDMQEKVIESMRVPQAQSKWFQGPPPTGAASSSATGSTAGGPSARASIAPGTDAASSIQATEYNGGVWRPRAIVIGSFPKDSGKVNIEEQTSEWWRDMPEELKTLATWPYAPTLWGSTIAKVRVYKAEDIPKVHAIMAAELRSRRIAVNGVPVWCAVERSPAQGVGRRAVRTAYNEITGNMGLSGDWELCIGSATIYKDRRPMMRWDAKTNRLRAMDAWLQDKELQGVDLNGLTQRATR